MLQVLLLACTPKPEPKIQPDPLCACSGIALPDTSIVEASALLELLKGVQVALYPEENGLNLSIEAVDDLQFFQAWIELSTLSNPPESRSYIIRYDPMVLSDPPEPVAVAAILGHELGHVLDYLGKDTEEMVSFAAWYGSEDPASSDALADYERGTDEKAMERGCADGLSRMREWIYAHVDPETEAIKRREYYTPEEIADWVSVHGACKP